LLLGSASLLLLARLQEKFITDPDIDETISQIVDVVSNKLQWQSATDGKTNVFPIFGIIAK
jgi:hypothetical protein